MKDNIFEQLAKKYDTNRQIELAEIITQEVRLELQNDQSHSLLDYGCGTGLVSLKLSDQVNSILLVDASEEMLKIAGARISKNGITNSEVLLADFTENTFDIKTDIILVSLVLLHIPNTKKILQELYHRLNEDGKLIIVDFDKNNQVNHPKIHSGFSHEYMKNILSEVGFKSIKIKTFHEGNNIFMNKDASMFIASSIK